MLSDVKRDLRLQNSTLILGGRGWSRQGKGISISTMQKGAILTEIKGINDIIKLLVVGLTLTYSRPNYRANSNYVMT